VQIKKYGKSFDYNLIKTLPYFSLSASCAHQV